MKNVLLALNAVLLVSVGALFFLYFRDRGNATEHSKTGNTLKDSASRGGGCRIAYFEMDSIENNYEMVREVKDELSRKQDEQNAAKMRLKNKFDNLYKEFQEKGPSLNEQQIQAYQSRLYEMDNSVKTSADKMDREYQDLYMRRMQDIKMQIEDFLKEYNSSGKYDYIFSYDPGIMYYRDTAYNITSDIVRGLNKLHHLKKK